MADKASRRMGGRWGAWRTPGWSFVFAGLSRGQAPVFNKLHAGGQKFASAETHQAGFRAFSVKRTSLRAGSSRPKRFGVGFGRFLAKKRVHAQFSCSEVGLLARISARMPHKTAGHLRKARRFGHNGPLIPLNAFTGLRKAV